MSVVIAIAAALIAGKAVGAIAAGLTIAQWLTLAQVGIGVGQFDIAVIKSIAAKVELAKLQHQGISRRLHGTLPHTIAFKVEPRLCFTGVPSGRSAAVCMETVE